MNYSEIDSANLEYASGKRTKAKRVASRYVKVRNKKAKTRKRTGFPKKSVIKM